MEDKTKNEIMEVLLERLWDDSPISEALAKICAIVDEERKGEVVVAHFTEPEIISLEGTDSCAFEYAVPGAGRLIFVPDKD